MKRHLRTVVSIGLLAGSTAASPKTDTRPISARTLDGGEVSSANQQGRIVIVNFWATWCVPCRAEMPALDAYYRRHRDQGLVVLAISVDAGASVKKLRAFTSAYSFAVARLDDTRIARSAIPTALPESRIYDRQGVLRYNSASGKDRPAIDEATLERIVTPLLAPGATTP